MAGQDQKRTLERLQYIVIEGCIGVGKTTLTKLLANRLAARTVVEVVAENPFLPEFYEDPVAHAFKTQMFFLLSRFKQQEDILQGDLFRSSVVADYLFAKDRIFAELTLSPSELALYDQVFGALSSKVKVPDLVIYLRAPQHIIRARIKKRGRDFEQDIDPDYLERLVASYDRYFGSFDDCPLLVVDTDALNFPKSPADVDLVLRAARDTFASGTKKRVLSGDAQQPSFI